MSARDLFLILIVFASLPYAFLRPLFGLVLFSWLAYMRPQDLTWGAARGMRFSLMVGAAMFLGWLFFEKRPFTRRFPQRKWLIGLLLFVTASLFLNPFSEADFQIKKWVELVKVFLVALLTVGLVDSKRRLDFLLWTIVLSLGFFGIKGGLFGLLTGGRILHGPGGMLEDNNDLALAMCMNLPLLWYLGHSVRSKQVRLAMTCGFVLSIMTVVLTTSRGGFLTMAFVLFLLVLKSRHRVVGIAGGVLAVAMFLVFLPQDVRDRLSTLQTPTEEGSALGRLYAWRVALEMGRQEPLLGVGFHNFTAVFRQYDPHPRAEWTSGKGESSIRVTHNSYLQVMAESGFPALICFLLLFPSSLLLLQRTRALGRARDGPTWAVAYADGMQVSLLAFGLGAMFLNRSHFDLFYHLIALTACLYLVARQEREARSRGSGPEGPATAVLTTKDPFLVREQASQGLVWRQ